MSTTATVVSRSSPAIKKIVAATVGPYWPGKHVVVSEVPASWQWTDDVWSRRRTRLEHAWYLNLDTLSAAGQVRVWKPDPELTRSDGPDAVHSAPQVYEALVHLYAMGTGKTPRLVIFVLDDAIDPQAIAVATDALLAGGKKAKEAAVKSASLCGATGGLCLAIAEANAKTLAKAHGFEDLTAASLTTSRTPSAKRQKKTAAQLDAEIRTILGRRS
jgi:hypothetical protein